MRWKLELANYPYDKQIRSNKDYIPADIFSRKYCSDMHIDTSFEFHDNLCHPAGSIRMINFVKRRN